MKNSTDCRTDEGIEVGLIDAIISIARVLRQRGIKAYPASLEALKDLHTDEDVDWLMKQAEDAQNNLLVPAAGDAAKEKEDE